MLIIRPSCREYSYLPDSTVSFFMDPPCGTVCYLLCMRKVMLMNVLMNTFMNTFMR